jgi:hypothetical protein
VFGSFDTCLLSLGLAIKPCVDLCPNNKHGSGSVDGCGDSDSPGMNRWDDSESYRLVGVGFDFLTPLQHSWLELWSLSELELPYGTI